MKNFYNGSRYESCYRMSHYCVLGNSIEDMDGQMADIAVLSSLIRDICDNPYLKYLTNDQNKPRFLTGTISKYFIS